MTEGMPNECQKYGTNMEQSIPTITKNIPGKLIHTLEYLCCTFPKLSVPRGSLAPWGGPGLRRGGNPWPLARPASGGQGAFEDPKHRKNMTNVCQKCEVILLAYLWHTFGIHLAYFWHTFGILFAYSWHTFNILLAYTCDIILKSWLHTCCTFVAYLLHTCIIRLAYFGRTCIVLLVYLWHVCNIF